MRILLLGEYSNVHWTLALGLRRLGHEVTVVSDGDRWKDYPRDIDIKRQFGRPLSGLHYILRLMRVMPKLKGYDVVQLINPVFFDLKAQRLLPFYRYVRRHNGAMVMGAFGMDKYWVKAGTDGHTFRYSDFNIGQTIRHDGDNDRWVRDWLHGPKGRLNDIIARDADAIVSGLYEYDASYRPYFADKLRFIPFPIDLSLVRPTVRRADDGVVRFFIGIQKTRSEYKGTDIMLRALMHLQKRYPTRCVVEKAENVPFQEYVKMLQRSHVLLDQLYSYTPAMNALQAMAQGMVVVGGGEEENYQILNEHELRPIVNVRPGEQFVYDALEGLLLHPERIAGLSRQSIEYIRRHHDHIHVARQYEALYKELIERKVHNA